PPAEPPPLPPPLPPPEPIAPVGKKVPAPAKQSAYSHAIRSTMRAGAGSFRSCYERLLARNPRLSAKVIVKFTIGADGHVTDADVRGSATPELKRCIKAAMKRIVFPPTHEPVKVVYPLLFRKAP